MIRNVNRRGAELASGRTNLGGSYRLSIRSMCVWVCVSPSLSLALFLCVNVFLCESGCPSEACVCVSFTIPLCVCECACPYVCICLCLCAVCVPVSVCVCVCVCMCV